MKFNFISRYSALVCLGLMKNQEQEPHGMSRGIRVKVSNVTKAGYDFEISIRRFYYTDYGDWNIGAYIIVGHCVARGDGAQITGFGRVGGNQIYYLGLFAVLFLVFLGMILNDLSSIHVSCAGGLMLLFAFCFGYIGWYMRRDYRLASKVLTSLGSVQELAPEKLHPLEVEPPPVDKQFRDSPLYRSFQSRKTDVPPTAAPTPPEAPPPDTPPRQ